MTGVNKERGVTEYDRYGETFYRVDIWVDTPEGKKRRVQRSGIPTLALAIKARDKIRTNAFEGSFFDRPQASVLDVRQAWKNYEPVSKRKNKVNTYKRNIAIAAHLIEHLGHVRAIDLNQRHVDAYCTRRESEETIKGTPPTVATVNREIALLKRLLNYAVKRGDITHNPLARVEMGREDNVRGVIIGEVEFQALLAAAEDLLKPILLVAYDTGLRKAAILGLRWSEVDLRERCLRLRKTDSTTKKRPPALPMTSRLHAALSALPRSTSGYVFVNPKTNRPWNQIQKMWDRARSAVGMEHCWFHDLRRSFITNARRRGVQESVIMKMSGHRTRNVFERYNVVDETDLRKAVVMIEEGCTRELKEVAGG